MVEVGRLAYKNLSGHGASSELPPTLTQPLGVKSDVLIQQNPCTDLTIPAPCRHLFSAISATTKATTAFAAVVYSVTVHFNFVLIFDLLWNPMYCAYLSTSVTLRH